MTSESKYAVAPSGHGVHLMSEAIGTPGLTADSPFRLSLLGNFSLSGPRGPIDLGNRKLCALLAFLVCASSDLLSRETLTTLLWGSQLKTQAQQNLRQMLTRLRRALGDDVFSTSDNALQIRPGLFDCDAISFESLIHTGSRDTRKTAVDLYQGSFLANIAIHEDAWTDWVVTQRQKLEDLAVDGLIRLGEEEADLGASTQALEFANRALAINSLREDGHRLIMRALASAGRRAEALKHYDHLAARLKRDLNVEPDAATTALITTLRRSRVAQDRVTKPTGNADAMLPRAPTNAPQETIRSTGIGFGVSASRPHTPLQDTLPSIAVLPFHNLSGDAGDDYFADGVVEDIIVSLAGLRELLVISRTSTFAYRGRQVDPREVGRSLGVRYVLEGSVRKSGTSIRVSTQLCDTETGASLWGERQEVPLGDLFEVQDRIVRDVVAGIAPNVQTAELERALRVRPASFTAYDHTLRALNTINNLDRQSFLIAREHLHEAMAAQPSFAMPAAWAAFWYIIWVGQGWSDSPREDSDRGASFATKAIDLDGHNALALATYGHLRSFLFHDYDSALVYFDRALSACPNSSWAWILSSITLSYVGRSDDAVRHAEHGLRLSPYDRNLFLYYTPLSIAHYSNGNYEDAVKWGRMSVAENPTFSACYRYLISALTGVGRLDEAHEAASNFLKLEPEFKLRVYEQTLQPFRDPAIKARHMEHLRKAGLPT